jgi:hypothetical protein
MKIFAASLLTLFLLSIYSSAQSTWIKKMSMNPDDTQFRTHDTLYMGLLQASKTQDGSVIAVVNINQRQDFSIVKIDPQNGNVINRHNYWGYDNYSVNRFGSILATPDSGYVYYFWYSGWVSDSYTDSYLKKYDKFGNLSWTRSFIHPVPNSTNYIYSIVLNQFDNLLVSQQDSLLELDLLTGNTMRSSSSLIARYMYSASNNDIIYYGNGILARVDSNRSQLWNFPCTCSYPKVLPANSPYIFATRGNTLYKIDLSTGALIDSTVTTAIPKFEMTKDGGIISEGAFEKYDSSGTLQWQRTRLFSEYGLYGVWEFPDGGYLTGGTYRLNHNASPPPSLRLSYSAFITRVDSLGFGVIDSTDKIWPGDAKDNKLVGFLDDALLIAQHAGATGTARDTTTNGNVPIFAYEVPYPTNEYAVDWGIKNSLGTDLKFSDIDGNGIIDSSDLSRFNFPANPNGTPVFYRENGIQQISTFHLIAERDTVAPSATIRFYMLAGSPSNPIDSVNGISFTASFNSFIADSIKMFAIHSALGDPAINMISAAGTSNMPGFLTCRTDFTNAYNLADTIGIIELQAAAVSSVTQFDFDLTGINALTAEGNSVLLNISGASVIIDPTLTNVNTLTEKKLSLYPNPTRNSIRLDFETKANRRISLYDRIGRKKLDQFTTDQSHTIHNSELEAGIYFIMVEDGPKLFTEKIIFLD